MNRILCLKIDHFTFHLAPLGQGIILPQSRSEMKGDLSFCLMSLSSFELLTESPRLSWPGSKVQRVGIPTARNHHRGSFVWSGQQLRFAGNVASRVTVWFLLPKKVVLGLLRLNVLPLWQNRVCNPKRKGGAFKPEFCKATWAAAIQIAPTCPFGFSRQRVSMSCVAVAASRLCRYMLGRQKGAGEGMGVCVCNAAASCPRRPPGRQSLTSRKRRAGCWPGWMPWSQWQLPSPLLFLPTPLHGRFWRVAS